MTASAFTRSGLAAIFGAVTLLCAPLCSPAPALASEAEKTAAAPSVQLGAVAIPAIVDGKIVNYLYLNVKVNLTSPVSESVLRAREPYFRDALIRAAYKTSFALPGHPTELDEARFKSAMMIAFTQIAGKNSIQSVEVVPKTPRKVAH
jgi:hypothetical protein